MRVYVAEISWRALESGQKLVTVRHYLCASIPRVAIRALILLGLYDIGSPPITTTVSLILDGLMRSSKRTVRWCCGSETRDKTSDPKIAGNNTNIRNVTCIQLVCNHVGAFG